MIRILVCSLFLCCGGSAALASKMNLDPYFGLGASSLKAEIGGVSSTVPSLTFIAGSGLNWISPYLAAELRFGFGGQYTTFSGAIDSFASYLLKPSLPITNQFDIYGLLGVTTLSVSLGGVSSSDTDITYGLGFRYHVPNESISIDGEFSQYHDSVDASVTNISGMKVTGASLSIVFDYY